MPVPTSPTNTALASALNPTPPAPLPLTRIESPVFFLFPNHTTRCRKVQSPCWSGRRRGVAAMLAAFRRQCRNRETDRQHNVGAPWSFPVWPPRRPRPDERWLSCWRRQCRSGWGLGRSLGPGPTAGLSSWDPACLLHLGLVGYLDTHVGQKPSPFVASMMGPFSFLPTSH